MDRVYYARKEGIGANLYKLALYDEPPVEEDESRIITWPIDWNNFHRNAPEIELKAQHEMDPPSSSAEVKKLRIRIEEVD